MLDLKEIIIFIVLMESTDLRASINKKVKNQKGQKVSINDIIWDQRPDHHNNPSSLIEISKELLNSNSLYKITFDNMVQSINKSAIFKKMNISEPKISFIYSRKWNDSIDLVINFFCKINSTTEFLFFEADLNTGSLTIERIKPKIYFIFCYKIVDEFSNPDYLISVANSALSFSCMKEYSVVKVVTARCLFMDVLSNPESFVLNCIINDLNNVPQKAILAYTIEDDSHRIGLALMELESSTKPLKNGDKIEEKVTEKRGIPEKNIQVTIKDSENLFKIAPENFYEIFTPNKLLNSKHMKSALAFMSNLIEVLKFNNKIEDLLSGVSMKNDNGVISMICDFSYIKGENCFGVVEATINCRNKLGSVEELEFELINVDHILMTQKKMVTGKNGIPNHIDLQKALDTLISEKEHFNYMKNSVVCDILSIHYLNNDKLIFPEHYGVSFTYFNSESKLGRGFIMYCIHDFDKSFMPIIYYDVNEKGNLMGINDISTEELLVDIKFMNGDQEKNYNIIMIPSNLNYQIHSYLEKYNQLIKSNILTKNKDYIFNESISPIVLYSHLRQFDDSTHDLVAYVQMKLESKIYIISEVIIKIIDLYSFNKENCELKAITSFPLIDNKESEYPDYHFILSLLWANSINNLNNGIEIHKIQRSTFLKNCYFSYIYYVEYQTLINSSSYSFVYGSNKQNETLIISPIFVIPNYKSSKIINK